MMKLLSFKFVKLNDMIYSLIQFDELKEQVKES